MDARAVQNNCRNNPHRDHHESNRTATSGREGDNVAATRDCRCMPTEGACDQKTVASIAAISLGGNLANTCDHTEKLFAQDVHAALQQAARERQDQDEGDHACAAVSLAFAPPEALLSASLVQAALTGAPKTLVRWTTRSIFRVLGARRAADDDQK